MSRLPKRVNLLGVFAHSDATVAAVKDARDLDIAVTDVFSPVPLHEVEHLLSSGKSPVRFATFAGGLIGLISGLALALLTSAIWNLVVGGKPVLSLVPFLVVGFELTILFGAIGTFVGVLVFCRLPYREFPAAGYRPAFSDDRFGVWLTCSADLRSQAVQVLEEAGAVEVQDLDDKHGVEPT